MTDYAHIEQLLTDALGLAAALSRWPYRARAPPGLPAIHRVGAVRLQLLAARGRGTTFSTVPGDHYNCPIGSHTHNIPLPPAREPELTDAVVDAEIGYIRWRRCRDTAPPGHSPGVVVNAPLADTPVEPDAVMVAGRPGRLMLLHEAAARAGKAAQPLLGRPTCTAIPTWLHRRCRRRHGLRGGAGCTGVSRAATLCTSISGKQIRAVAEQLGAMVRANATALAVLRPTATRLTDATLVI